MQIVKLYTAQIVKTLAYLREMQIMHRDMKPQNMMLDEDMNIKIVRATDPPKDSLD